MGILWWGEFIPLVGSGFIRFLGLMSAGGSHLLRLPAGINALPTGVFMPRLRVHDHL